MHENIDHGYFWCQIAGDFYSFSSFSMCVYVCVIYTHMHIFTYFRYTLHKYVVYTYVYLYTYIPIRLAVAQYAIGEQWRNNSRKNEEMETKQKQYPGVGVTGDGSKVGYCKEQYCIGTWNVRSMNQNKLEVVKQEMARVNIDILGISKIKWTGMSEFNSDDHYTYYCGQESHRRNGVAIIVNKRD